MTIVKYRPSRWLMGWPRWMDEWDENFPSSGFASQKDLKIKETEKNIIVEAVVAGVPKDQVEVEIEDGVLTVKAQTKEEEKGKKEYKMTSYQYYYTTALSGGKWNKAEADITDGIVKVTIPKEEAAKPQKIAIKAK